MPRRQEWLLASLVLLAVGTLSIAVSFRADLRAARDLSISGG